MNETFQQIQHLSHERLNLYRLAGQQTLNPDQVNRIHLITGKLDTLWDQHRREHAASKSTQVRKQQRQAA